MATSLVDLPPPTPSELIEYVGKFAWDETLTRLSVLASIVANGGGPAGKLARSHTTDLFLRSDPAKMPLRGRMLWNAVSSLDTVPPAANEAAIYFLQALALVYGAETGPAPSDGEITEMLIAANDYAFEWRTGRDEDLARRERIVADTVRALGFNRMLPDIGKRRFRARLAEREPSQARQLRSSCGVSASAPPGPRSRRGGGSSCLRWG